MATNHGPFIVGASRALHHLVSYDENAVDVNKFWVPLSALARVKMVAGHQFFGDTFTQACCPACALIPSRLDVRLFFQIFTRLVITLCSITTRSS